MYQSTIEEDRWNEIKKIWQGHQWLYVIVGAIGGLILSAFWTVEMRIFVEGLVPEAFGIFFTVIVIDQLAERRSKKQLFRNLAWQMKNHDNGTATEATYLLREYGWLTDGSLRNNHLHRGNLEQVWLDDADLQGCDFSRTNLHLTYLSGANLRFATGLTETKLSQVSSLRAATMPDGSRYDGRYNLSSDLRNAQRQNIDLTDAQAMSHFYGVSLEEYQAGQQKFAQRNRNSESS